VNCWGNGTSTVPYPGISIGKVHDASMDKIYPYPYIMHPIATGKIRKANQSLKDMRGGIGGGRGSLGGFLEFVLTIYL